MFDLSACQCELPNNITCNDRRLKCKKENCPFKDNHTICTCEPHIKVPNEEDRVYLRDQRNKVGPKGCFQLGKTDKKTVQLQPKDDIETVFSRSFDSNSEASILTSSEESRDGIAVESSPEFRPIRRASGDYYLTKNPR